MNLLRHLTLTVVFYLSVGCQADPLLACYVFKYLRSNIIVVFILIMSITKEQTHYLVQLGYEAIYSIYHWHILMILRGREHNKDRYKCRIPSFQRYSVMCLVQTIPFQTCMQVRLYIIICVCHIKTFKYFCIYYVCAIQTYVIIHSKVLVPWSKIYRVCK